MSDLPPANWYPDPEVPGQQRYWDGTQWTEHRAPGAGAQQPAQDPSWQQQPAAAPQWGQQQPGGQPQWGQQHGYAQPTSGSNGLAITSLVVSILSFFLAFVAFGALGGILAVVLGVIALKQIKAANGAQGGRGMAIAGIIVGAVSIVIGAIVFVLIAFVTTAVEQGGPAFTDFFECIEEEARTGQDLDC